MEGCDRLKSDHESESDKCNSDEAVDYGHDLGLNANSIQSFVAGKESSSYKLCTYLQKNPPPKKQNKKKQKNKQGFVVLLLYLIFIFWTWKMEQAPITLPHNSLKAVDTIGN